MLHAAARYKRPVYIEIPRDMVDVVPESPHRFIDPQRRATPKRWPRRWPRPSGGSTRPGGRLIIAGVEIHRFGLQDELLALAERRGDSDRRPRCSARA